MFNCSVALYTVHTNYDDYDNPGSSEQSVRHYPTISHKLCTQDKITVSGEAGMKTETFVVNVWIKEESKLLTGDI